MPDRRGVLGASCPSIRATPDRGCSRRAGAASCIRARRSHVTSPGTMRTSVARLPSRLALCGLLAGLTVAGPAAGATSLTMALHGGLLTADVAGTPVSRVMQEVGRLTGAEVRWLGAVGEEPISVRFTDVPLADAIARLVG